MSMTAPDFQSFMGPGDKNLVQNGEQGSLINGYQPVSRIGEVVMNSFGARPAPRAPRPALCAPRRSVPGTRAQSTRTSLAPFPSS